MNGLLIDENLPVSLGLPTQLPIEHVTSISASPTDTVVWEHARKRSLVVVTKDADFGHRILSSEPPPWIVHVRLGNLRLTALIQHLTTVWPEVESLLPKHKLVSVLSTRIEAIE